LLIRYQRINIGGFDEKNIIYNNGSFDGVFGIGKMRYSPAFGFLNFTTKTVDVYGHYTIVPREKSKWLRCSLIVENTAIDELNRQMMLYADTPIV
jgi:hypothetical protein